MSLILLDALVRWYSHPSGLFRLLLAKRQSIAIVSRYGGDGGNMEENAKLRPP